jgi:hypothetical protein
VSEMLLEINVNRVKVVSFSIDLQAKVSRFQADFELTCMFLSSCAHGKLFYESNEKNTIIATEIFALKSHEKRERSEEKKINVACACLV